MILIYNELASRPPLTATSMKKIHSLILTLTTGLLLLSGCSFSSGTSVTGTNNPQDATMQTYETDDYQITVPKAWQITRKNEFTSDIPSNVSVALQANRKNEIFVTNVNITKNTLGEALSSLDYGKVVLENQKTVLQNFSEKGREESDTTINGKKQTILLAKFNGKRSAADPLLTFFQAYYVDDRTGYIATAAYASNEDPSVQKEAEQIVRSFSIK